MRLSKRYNNTLILSITRRLSDLLKQLIQSLCIIITGFTYDEKESIKVMLEQMKEILDKLRTKQ